MIFLSYAEEDTADAHRIRDALRDKDLTVYDWQESGGGRIVEDIEEKLLGASAFVAVLSPDYLASHWCRRERALALFREVDMASAQFLWVVEVGTVSHLAAGFLREYKWIDLRNLSRLVDSLGAVQEDSVSPSGVGHQLSTFRNREEELAKVRNALTNSAGLHLWLVVAPPQLGKTWFMDRLASQLDGDASPWTSALVDLREYPSERLRDPELLLAHLLGETHPITGRKVALAAAAHRIRQRRKPHLCMLDSAELLDPQTSAVLRSRLLTTSKYVQDGGNLDVRLALIVCTRRAEGWLGVDPHGRLETLELTEFPVHIIKEALNGLRHEMGTGFDFDTLDAQARWVRRQTEGLPALLVRCMQWIRDNGFLPRELLDRENLFAELASPYVRDRVLSEGSLFPGTGNDDNLAAPRQVLIEAFRVLSPYRLFTQSHLRHYLRLDARLRAAADAVGWAEADVFLSIEGTALLRQNDEIWHELHPTIRRLLYRYHYPSEADQLDAHRKAADVVEEWSVKVTGSDQLAGFAECLWHKASILRITDPNGLIGQLCESAEALRSSLLTEPWTTPELRRKLADRINRDYELAGLVGEDFPQLIATLRGENERS